MNENSFFPVNVLPDAEVIINQDTGQPVEVRVWCREWEIKFKAGKVLKIVTVINVFGKGVYVPKNEFKKLARRAGLAVSIYEQKNVKKGSIVDAMA